MDLLAGYGSSSSEDESTVVSPVSNATQTPSTKNNANITNQQNNKEKSAVGGGIGDETIVSNETLQNLEVSTTIGGGEGGDDMLDLGDFAKNFADDYDGACDPSTTTKSSSFVGPNIALSFDEMKEGGQQKLLPLLVVPSLPPMNYNMQHDSHMDVCFICGDDGELICCDGAGCNKAYHAKCTKVDINALPPTWNCPSCRLGVGHQSASPDESVSQYVPAADAKGGLATTTSFNIGCIVSLQIATSCYNGQVGVIKSISTDTIYTIELQSNKELVRAKLNNMKRYTPNGNDVILGRGQVTQNLPGNIKYRDIITQNKPRYQSAEKGDKKSISEGIVQQIRDGGGYFLEEGNDNNWYDIGDKKACGKVSQALRDTSVDIQMTKMPVGYTPKGNDVILGRGSQQYNALGNIKYRDLIAQNKSRYQEEGRSSKDTKASIINGIIEQLRGMSPPANFVEQKDGAWYSICDTKLYGKVAQALREKSKKKKSTSTVVAGNTKKTGESKISSTPSTKKNIKKVARSRSSSSMIDEDQPPKKKQKKEPDAPKRPRTAYTLYTSNKDNRARVKAANPDAAYNDQAKLLTTEYHALSKDKRARWDQLAAEDKERYAREMEEYSLKSLPQQERVKTAEDSTDIVQPPAQYHPQPPTLQPPTSSELVRSKSTISTTDQSQTIKAPMPTMNTPSVTNKHQQTVGTNREIVTPQTLPKNHHNNHQTIESIGVPSNNKENSISSTETLVNMDRVHAMEESSRRERKVMVTSHLKQMMDKTATIVLERVDGLIGCHTKDKDELHHRLEKKFGDKKKSIVNEIAKLNTMLANANERGHRTTDIDADLNRETTKLKSINAEFESEKNEWLDRLKNKYVSLYEATKEEFIDLGTNQLPLSVIDICSAKWNTYLDGMSKL